jgi:hypothetical protein
MTIDQELTLLETAYSAILTKGVQSYKIGDRELTRLDLPFITARMDILRAQQIRATSGCSFASQFRKPE